MVAREALVQVQEADTADEAGTAIVEEVPKKDMAGLEKGPQVPRKVRVMLERGTMVLKPHAVLVAAAEAGTGDGEITDVEAELHLHSVGQEHRGALI